MDTLISSWVVVCGTLTALAVAVVMVLRRRADKPGPAPRETPTVALVRRRRDLMARLREVAGDRAGELLQTEARRQGASVSSLAVLEAVLARAEQQAQPRSVSARL